MVYKLWSHPPSIHGETPNSRSDRRWRNNPSTFEPALRGCYVCAATTNRSAGDARSVRSLRAPRSQASSINRPSVLTRMKPAKSRTHYHTRPRIRALRPGINSGRCPSPPRIPAGARMDAHPVGCSAAQQPSSSDNRSFSVGRHNGLIRRVVVALAGVLYVAAAAPVAAEPPAAVTVTGSSHAVVPLTIEDLARLPAVKLDVAFLTEHGERRASFEGPLLWTVLAKADAVDPARPREQVSRSVIVTGRDGYRAVLAVAEIAPDFEGKQVILAERMDGHPLGEGHLRVVVPLDKRGGRSVRDVARIEVTALQP